MYASALAKPEKFNLMTPLDDKPITLQNGKGKRWSPQNVDRHFNEEVPLLTAFKKSMNVPTVNLGMKIGIKAVMKTLKNAGWNEKLSGYPSMLLGAVNGSPLMVAQLFHTLADSGRYHKLHTVTHVLNVNDKPLIGDKLTTYKAIREDTNYLVQYAMTQVVQSGTVARLGRHFPHYRLAGKTGTSNDSRDSWFAGFDERNVAAIWVGRDDNGKTPLYGSSGAMAVYQAFLQHRPPLSLRMPAIDGVVDGYFEQHTGVAQERDCEGVIRVPALVTSYQPEPNCGEPLSWWQKILAY